MLSCSVHACPSKCHQLHGHSKMTCSKIVEWTCSRGHRLMVACFQKNGTCHLCNAEDELKERRRQRDVRLDVERSRKQKEYERTLARLQDEIENERRLKKDEYEASQRQKVLDQHRADLTRLKSKTDTLAESKNNDCFTGIAGHSPNGRSQIPDPFPDQGSSPKTNHMNIKDATGNSKHVVSGAQADWSYQKRFERAQSDEIDALMGMILDGNDRS